MRARYPILETQQKKKTVSIVSIFKFLASRVIIIAQWPTKTDGKARVIEKLS